LDSAELAAQAIELYWMALCRDVNFMKYETDPLAIAAAAELSELTAFGGPKSSGIVTSQTLFRGFTAGDVIGPYVSQFLLKKFSYGPYEMDALTTVPLPGDYLTTADRWLASQKGQGHSGRTSWTPSPAPSVRSRPRKLRSPIRTPALHVVL
jgi:hypothetical protein